MTGSSITLSSGDHCYQIRQDQPQPDPEKCKDRPSGSWNGKDGIIIPFSAETKQGRDEIWRLIEDTMADVNENTAAEAEEKTEE